MEKDTDLWDFLLRFLKNPFGWYECSCGEQPTHEAHGDQDHRKRLVYSLQGLAIEHRGERTIANHAGNQDQHPWG